MNLERAIGVRDSPLWRLYMYMGNACVYSLHIYVGKWKKNQKWEKNVDTGVERGDDDTTRLSHFDVVLPTEHERQATATNTQTWNQKTKLLLFFQSLNFLIEVRTFEKTQ